MAPARSDALVRIACEALTNVARHSGSPQVSLVLRRYGARVLMRVSDSGHGFDTTVCRGGFGSRRCATALAPSAANCASAPSRVRAVRWR